MWDKFIAYLKNNIPLVIVLAVILVMVIVLVVLLVLEIRRAKKKRREKTDEAAPAPEPVKEEPVPEPVKEEPVPEPVKEEPVPEPVKEEPAPEPVKEEPAPEPVKEEPAPEPVKEEPAPEPVKEESAPEPAKEEQPQIVVVPVKGEKSRQNGNKKTAAPAAKEEDMKQGKPETKKAPVKAAPVKKAVPVKAPAKKDAVGKWVLYEEDRGGYGFRLVASNGEQMLKSSSPYSTQASAKSGIKTYQDNIAAGRLEVVETKKGNFFVQINNGSKRLLATSADYPTRAACTNAMESIKRWAANAVIVVEQEEEKK